MRMIAWTFLNDEFVESKKATLHYTDLSIQRAYGVFDFFKVTDGIEQSVDDHLDRLYSSAYHMRLNIGYDKLQMKDLIHKLIQKNEFRNGGIKITLTGGYSEDGYELGKPNLIIACHSLPTSSPESWKQGIQLITYRHQRQLPDIKTIDYIMPIWLRPFIKSKHADDVLYYNQDLVTECPRSNFFIVTEDNRLITPKDNILKGITRKKVLSSASSIFEIEERNITLNEVYNAGAAFISSTSKLIVPVIRIDNKHYSRSINVSEKLRKELNTMYGTIF